MISRTANLRDKGSLLERQSPEVRQANFALVFLREKLIKGFQFQAPIEFDRIWWDGAASPEDSVGQK